MILKEINKRIIALITLCFFLLSTSGMILFYHYCLHSHQMVFSVYIDATQELCQENALTFHDHTLSEECCNHHSENAKDDCCENHKSDQEMVKLKDEYNFSDRQSTPRPTTLLLINTDEPTLLEAIPASITNKGLFKKLPPGTPLFILKGKELVTLHQALKVAC
ncbi:HYC_CC_PP family protein [Saccharicrinis fermentans]|uniref:Uncharacterized protein n=1 Tax=Saccharicrinis fermentans DSM 9555 = JCM 21142 TaxID=869213 RepID=W7Y2A9_9BACT|nr:hypothetical protein [Saccharicrinis fermentans]GAF04990.1 hypothetical protein JCM21142_93713 [Saccharicrinis fermentans DSM 9555 = JCM 21142]